MRPGSTLLQHYAQAFQELYRSLSGRQLHLHNWPVIDRLDVRLPPFKKDYIAALN
ncbi:hypothetical protein D3C78_1994770 [compost metagenome]